MNKEEEIARAAANEYLDRFRIFVNSIVGEMGKDKRLYSGKLIAILRAFPNTCLLYTSPSPRD